ncbi:hypothetical protein [Mariniblastus fucicola]|uniref:Uncharacterized protein n=1 Tax=Mariniblastus fucicola TaxID=980251 RepID=A0A5B9PCB3_9BACT|nr:hypothetical protein [Mariniblastus fucicola]QEG22156.1 hypothetical protein MFFC18_20170 [Mariniblastus fucicola]
MLFLPALLFGLLVQCLIGSLIGAVILRAACSLFNRFFGGENEVVPTHQPPVKLEVDIDVSSEAPVSFDSPYASPTTPLAAGYPDRPPCKFGVPSPSFGNAFLICLSTTLIQNFIGFAVGFAASYFVGGNNWLAIILQLGVMLIGFLVLTAMVKIQLPTTVGRALGVASLFFLVTIAIVAILAAIIAAVMYGTM